MRIRTGLADEAEQVRDIERAAGTRFAGIGMAEIAAHEPTSASALVERAEDGRLFVAEADGDLVGFAIFSVLDGHGHLEEVAVLPAAAGRGVGAALIDAVQAEAALRGCAAVTLSTFHGVPWNAPWYRRLGFIDSPPEALGPGHAAEVARHAANGLDPATRVWMIRPTPALRPGSPS